MTTTWPEAYETVLRQNLPHLEPTMEVVDELRLDDVGLDSLRAIDLLVQLEHVFQVAVPDEQLDRRTFETARSLWDVIAGAGGSPPGAGG